MRAALIAFGCTALGAYLGDVAGAAIGLVLAVPLLLVSQARGDRRDIRRALDRPPEDDDRY